MRYLIALALVASPALAAEPIQGPVMAEVVRVKDGDTVEVRARPWLGMVVETSVRISGIDTPEKGRLAKCDRERQLGEAATEKTRGMLPEGAEITLHDIKQDKYGGRVVARIVADGADVGSEIIRAGLAKPYDGGKKDGWCK